MKSPRKYRVWDNTLLFNTVQLTQQIAGKIEDKCIDEVQPEDLPMSLVPTAELYNIVSCFNSMYDKLLDEDLITAGYPKSTSKTH